MRAPSFIFFYFYTMHISHCLNPKRIFNKYKGEFMYVPCGKCDACRNQRAFNWTQRLDYECRCWRYTAFVTLTYAPENLPLLKKVGRVFVDLTHKHFAPDVESPVIQIDDYLGKDNSRLLNWFDRIDSIPFVSSYDVQCFIKRLRKNCINYCKKHFKDFNSYDYKVRYYACGEYGSTTQKPHYHLLFFFNSEKEAAYFEEVVRASWKLGIVDFSYVINSCARYVASYINSFADLPKVYQDIKQIRPFSLCSKMPPLGTLFLDEEEVRKVFDSASPVFLLPNFNSLTLESRPLWQTYVLRLFPRISGFSKFNDIDRVRLYGVYEKWQNFSLGNTFYAFKDYVKYHFENKIFNSFYTHLFDDYIKYLFENVEYDKDSIEMSLYRWYAASSRVFNQSDIFGISTLDYYKKIVEFYDNVEMFKLKSQYDFQIDYYDKYNSCPIGLYRDFFFSVCDLKIEDVTYEEFIQLESFGIDPVKFFSDDMEERLEYQYSLEPDYQLEFINHGIDCASYARKLVKNKKKNDYLEANPELKKLIY